MKKKTALIFGITGQDGSYLAELLIKKGYFVHGVKRRSSSFNTGRIDHLYQDPHEKRKVFFLHYGDVTDAISVSTIIKNVKPDEIYNLAAQSHVAVSFEVPECRCNWCSKNFRVNKISWLRKKNKILSSWHFRNVWKGKRNSSK